MPRPTKSCIWTTGDRTSHCKYVTCSHTVYCDLLISNHFRPLILRPKSSTRTVDQSKEGIKWRAATGEAGCKIVFTIHYTDQRGCYVEDETLLMLMNKGYLEELRLVPATAASPHQANRGTTNNDGTADNDGTTGNDGTESNDPKVVSKLAADDRTSADAEEVLPSGDTAVGGLSVPTDRGLPTVSQARQKMRIVDVLN